MEKKRKGKTTTYSHVGQGNLFCQKKAGKEGFRVPSGKKLVLNGELLSWYQLTETEVPQPEREGKKKAQRGGKIDREGDEKKREGL